MYDFLFVQLTLTLEQCFCSPLFLPVTGKDEKDSSPSSFSHASPLKIHGDSASSTPAQGKLSREDLNAAIEAGDWAVVGATAALLADSTGSFGHSDNSFSGSEHQSSFRSDMDTSSYISASDASDANDRARELDRMVETGDWEGVVQAAAQFEGKTNAASDVDSHFTERSEATESSKRKEEIRQEVEKLVKRVVPDEIGECSVGCVLHCLTLLLAYSIERCSTST